MFGIGSILGKVAGGLLDKVGLGSLTPFVKMGLNAMTGNWLGVAKDVFDMVSNFKGNSLNGASKLPPLGGFGDQQGGGSSDGNSIGGRLGDLFKALGNLFNPLGGGDENGGGNDPFSKILNAFKAISDSFSNNQLFSNRLSISQFTNIQA